MCGVEISQIRWYKIELGLKSAIKQPKINKKKEKGAKGGKKPLSEFWRGPRAGSLDLSPQYNQREEEEREREGVSDGDRNTAWSAQASHEPDTLN